MKDERGLKGDLSTFISIAGKYIVLMPNTAKAVEFQEKYLMREIEKIRNILNEIIIPKEMGIIVELLDQIRQKMK